MGPFPFPLLQAFMRHHMRHVPRQSSVANLKPRMGKAAGGAAAAGGAGAAADNSRSLAQELEALK